MKRVAIIGGGIAGLAAAHRLLETTSAAGQPLHINLFEAANRLGGIIKTEARDGFLLEHGPDSFITEKPEALELAERLGLGDRLQPTNEKHRRSFIVRNGRLVPIPAGFHLIAPTRFWPFINSEIVSWPAKARMALDIFLPAKHANGKTDESLAEFVRRRFGQEALERVAQPMIGGIYTANPENLSLQATMPRFIEMEQQHRSVIRGLRRRSISGQQSESTSGARYGLFASFDRGMQVLVDALTTRLGSVQISLKTAIKSIEFDRAKAEWKLSTAGGAVIPADAVCLGLPAVVASWLLAKTDEALSRELSRIKYESSATINLAYRREAIPHKLDGFGFVVPFVEKRSLIACTFTSVKFANRAPEGYALLRAFVGGALQPELIGLDDEEMLARVRSDLRDLLGCESPPLFHQITRWPRSMPQYEIGHLERVKKIEERLASLPGLTLAGNAYAGVGLPDCIRSGEAAAESMLAALGPA